MVCGARGDRQLLWVGLEALRRFSAGADGSQPAACFRCLCPYRGGRTLGRALHPPALARAGRDFDTDPFRETRRPASVSHFWTSTHPPGRGKRCIAAYAAPLVRTYCELAGLPNNLVCHACEFRKWVNIDCLCG